MLTWHGLFSIKANYTRPTQLQEKPPGFCSWPAKSASVSVHNPYIFHSWHQMCRENICFMPLHVKPGLRRHVQTPSVYTDGPSVAPPSVVFFGPVIYYNVLIGVYVFPTVCVWWAAWHNSFPASNVGQKITRRSFCLFCPCFVSFSTVRFSIQPSGTGWFGGAAVCVTLMSVHVGSQIRRNPGSWRVVKNHRSDHHTFCYCCSKLF